MAPGWRHDDLMTLKMLLERHMAMTYDCAKIEMKLTKLILSYPVNKKV